MLVARGGAHRHPWRQHNRGAGGQRSVVLCCAVLCCAVLYVAVLRCALRCFAVLCGALRCFAVLCGALRCGAVRCGAVRCGVVWRWWGRDVAAQTQLRPAVGARSVCCSPFTCCLSWLALLPQVIRNPLDVVLSAYQYHTQVGARSGLGICCQCCCRLQ